MSKIEETPQACVNSYSEGSQLQYHPTWTNVGDTLFKLNTVHIVSENTHGTTSVSGLCRSGKTDRLEYKGGTHTNITTCLIGLVQYDALLCVRQSIGKPFATVDTVRTARRLLPRNTGHV